MIHNIRHMPHVVPIGIQTETGVEAIGFDVKPWLDEYDGLTITVWPTRPGEGAAYPAADVKLVGTVLYWTPNATDTAISGVGRVEILGIAEGKRKLSGYCDTLVKGTSLDVTQDTPDPIKPWVDQVVEAGAQAMNAVDKMPKISPDGTWMVWDNVLKVYADTGLPSRGEAGPAGEPGVAGPAGPQGIQGVAGPAGERGPAGEQGVAGPAGPQGIQGVAGPAGERGPAGPQGEPGVAGPAGPQGIQGIAGPAGERGPAGPQGEPGVAGPTGPQGIQGVAGPAGERGPAGPQGEPGDTRVYVGSDEPPEDAEVWIDPEGAVTGSDLPAATEKKQGAVILDASLTKAGAAADAKAVGDKVAQLSEEIAKLPQGGGGGSAIIDVTALPETDVRDDVFYRLVTGTFYVNGAQFDQFVCHVVDALPETGEPVSDGSLMSLVMYYSTTDETVNGYAPAELAAAFGLEEGWYPAEMLFQVTGVSYGGVVTDINEASADGVLYLLLEYAMYQYKSGVWTALKGIGWVGEGDGAEVFNTNNNIASGGYSHAEGVGTTAAGNASHAEGIRTTVNGHEGCHAEGYETTAEGMYGSHAEGRETRAEGHSSHAEGYITTAEGNYSHAEGRETIASGISSHAEGTNTIAASAAQHVQGKYNVEDASSKYAHIVGNGYDEDIRSNAHTLDWDGNAWFAGGIELTSPNGTRYRFTVSDDGTLNATVVTA